MPVKVYEEHGIAYRHEELAEGMTEVDVYTQHHTVVPDNGHKWSVELQRVLHKAGIASLILSTHRRRTAPMGSGPGGRVRFGDDMMHATWRVAVRSEDADRANAAIAAHKEAIRKWLHEGVEIPEECRQ